MKRRVCLAIGVCLFLGICLLILIQVSLESRANEFIKGFGFGESIFLKEIKTPTEGMSRLYYLLNEDPFSELPRIIECSKEIGLSTPSFEDVNFENLRRFETQIKEIDGNIIDQTLSAYTIVIYDINIDKKPIYAYILVFESSKTIYMPMNTSYKSFTELIESFEAWGAG